MMPLRALIACLILLTLPLQGVAAAVPAMHCLDAGAVHSGHVHGPAGSDHQHHDPAPAMPDGGDTAGHSCCHHVCPAAQSTLMPFGLRIPDTVASRVHLLATLFIPDLPQRPPRA